MSLDDLLVRPAQRAWFWIPLALDPLPVPGRDFVVVARAVTP